MNLNSVLFPAPTCSFSPHDLFGELIWIPKMLTAEENLNHAHSFRSSITSDFRFPTGSPLSYNNQPQKRANNKAFDSVCKPEINDEGLDDLSIITTASSKKLHGIDKAKINEGDFDEEEEEEKGSSTINTKNAENGPISEKTSPSSNHMPKILSTASKNTKENDGFESVDLSISCIEEPLSNAVISNYPKKIPSPSFLNEKRVLKTSVSGISDLRPKATNFSSQNKPNNTIQANKIAGETLKFCLAKNSQPKSTGPKVISSVNGPLNPKITPLLRDQSMSSFDLGRIDEFGEQKAFVGTPRSLENYSTRRFSKPTTERVSETRPDEEEHEVRFDLITDLIEEASNPGTHRKGLNQYSMSTALFAEKRPDLVSSVLCPSPQNRFDFKKHRQTEIGFRTLNPTPKKPTVSTINTAQQKKKEMGYIPCRLLCSGAPTSKLMVYFHGNGEDINLAYDLLSHIRNNLNIHVMAVEYPGYGLYKGTANEAQILEDSEAVYDYLISSLKLQPQQIILFGRSIGSGPATYLASKKRVGALILMSAFTSIRSVVKDLAGSWAQFLIKERFNNLEAIAKVICPTFLVHGQNDRLISYLHSERLHDVCKAPCELFLPKTMDHVEFDFYEDFTSPLIQFLQRCNFEFGAIGTNKSRILFPEKLFHLPESMKAQFKKEQKEEKDFARCKTEGPAVTVSLDVWK